MKKLCALVLLSGCISSFASSFDGIYTCSVNVLGSLSQSYVTINSQPTGAAVFAVAAVTPTTNFYGYGIGSTTATTFSGSTMHGQPFSFNLNTTTGLFTGQIGITSNGASINSTVSCSKVF
jgi:hypothetical protein